MRKLFLLLLLLASSVRAQLSPASSSWKIQFCEFAMIFLGCFIVSMRCLFRRKEISYMDSFPLKSNIALPLSRLAVKTNSFVSAFIVRVFTAVSAILGQCRWSKISSAIIKRVRIFVVRSKSSDKLMHEKMFSSPRAFVIPAHPHGVKLASPSFLGIPIPLIEPLKVSGIDNRILISGQGNKAVRLVRWLRNCVAFHAKSFSHSLISSKVLLRSHFLIVAFFLVGNSAYGQLSPASSSSGSITTNGATCAVTNACVVLHMATSNVGYSATVAGTWTGTLTVEQSGDNQGSWTSATTTTSNTLYTSALTPGITDVRVRGSAAMTGAAVVTITASGPAILQNITQTGGGGVSPNSPLPAASSGPGPVFNVKNYGAKADTQSSGNCTAAGFNLNCTDITFTSANVGQRVSCANNFSTIQPATARFSAFVNATNMTMDTSNSGAGICIFGSLGDDAAVTTTMTAALAQMTSNVGGGNLGVSTAAPCLYFPAGEYNLFNTSINVAPSSARSGFCIKGDGADVTKIYWHTGSTNGQGAAVTCTGNVNNLVIEGITFDGGTGNQFFSNGAVFTNCNTLARNVIVQRFNAIGWNVQGTLFGNKLVVSANNSTGMISLANAEIYESLFTNNQGAGLIVQNVTGANQGGGLRMNDSLFDENSGGGGCDVQILNSTDVWFQGVPIFSSTGGTLCGLSVDTNSFVHYNGGLIGVFGSESNRGGAIVSAGGTLESSGVHYISTGTQKCIQNSGKFRDNGGNTCESQFPIASGTSTGTTAVLTLTNVGAAINTNCTVGDSLYVKASGISGYNGYFPSAITATSATTLTYLTQGSNLGALGAGGTANCLNLQGYSGTLPVALLNNPIPNTCHLTITPIVNATNYLLCNFRAQSATNITRIMASSQNVTTCATAPIITISDGTATQTLTLTSAKQQWDSSVDASTGVGTTIFKPNGTITVRYDVAAASACATPPTQLAISYNISPILSN